MTTTTSIPLTIEQLEVLNGTGSWLKLTDEQRALAESCGPDERLVLFGHEFFRISTDTLKACLEAAYSEACRDALERAVRHLGMRVKNKDRFEFKGSTWNHMDPTACVRWTIARDDGQSVTGIGKVPNPRAH